jgi:hypothetical protein
MRGKAYLRIHSRLKRGWNAGLAAITVQDVSSASGKNLAAVIRGVARHNSTRLAATAYNKSEINCRLWQRGVQ